MQGQIQSSRILSPRVLYVSPLTLLLSRRKSKTINETVAYSFDLSPSSHSSHRRVHCAWRSWHPRIDAHCPSVDYEPANSRAPKKEKTINIFFVYKLRTQHCSRRSSSALLDYITTVAGHRPSFTLFPVVPHCQIN